MLLICGILKFGLLSHVQARPPVSRITTNISQCIVTVVTWGRITVVQLDSLKINLKFIIIISKHLNKMFHE